LDTLKQKCIDSNFKPNTVDTTIEQAIKAGLNVFITPPLTRPIAHA